MKQLKSRSKTNQQLDSDGILLKLNEKYSTSITMAISFALHDKKFCLLAQNKHGMSVGLAWVLREA